MNILTHHGFAGVHPEHKFQIVQTGDDVNDALALKTSSVGIVVAGAADTTKGASAIHLASTELSVIVEAIGLTEDLSKHDLCLI